MSRINQISQSEDGSDEQSKTNDQERTAASPSSSSSSSASASASAGPRARDAGASRSSSSMPYRTYTSSSMRNTFVARRRDGPVGRRRKRPLVTGGPLKTDTQKRHKPGMRALKEIRKYQNSSQLLIRRLPFARVVKEISEQYSDKSHNRWASKWQAQAIEALQEASEAMIVQLFEDA